MELAIVERTPLAGDVVRRSTSSSGDCDRDAIDRRCRDRRSLHLLSVSGCRQSIKPSARSMNPSSGRRKPIRPLLSQPPRPNKKNDVDVVVVDAAATCAAHRFPPPAHRTDSFATFRTPPALMSTDGCPPASLSLSSNRNVIHGIFAAAAPPSPIDPDVSAAVPSSAHVKPLCFPSSSTSLACGTP